MKNPNAPMLASPFKSGVINIWSNWSIEMKYDGHRMAIVVVDGEPRLFARPRGDGRTIERTAKVSVGILNELKNFPNGVYDGELLAGDTGTDVAATERIPDQRLMIFDVLEVEGNSWRGSPYLTRRVAMTKLFAGKPEKFVKLAPSISALSEKSMEKIVQTVWDDGGEGVILKLNTSIYHAGKRTKDWLKIKRESHAILTVVGFEPSKGTVRFPGHPFAIVKLRDDEGNETTVKTKDDEELAKFEAEWTATRADIKNVGTDYSKHPAIGRRLVIEFPCRTRYGGYQGPVRWDRWAEKGETL